MQPEHTVDAGFDQLFAQDALPDHAGRAEDEDSHPDVPKGIAAQAATALSQGYTGRRFRAIRAIRAILT